MMDERRLKDALFEANVALADNYDNGSFEFSSKVNRKIHQLIFRERHPITYTLKNTAAVIIALLLGGAIILGSSESARAAVAAWFSSVFEGTFLYRGQYDSDVDVSAYSIRNLVTSDFTYSEADSYSSTDSMCETYIDSEGYYLYLYIIRPTEGAVTQLLPDEGDEVAQVIVGGFAVDHYYDQENSSNAYVWRNEDGTLFYLGGRISEAELNKLTLSFMQLTSRKP